LATRDSLYVIWAYSEFLQINDFNMPNDIEVAAQFLEADFPQVIIAEWTLEQIAREVIQYSTDNSKAGKSLRQWGTLAQIANTLRDLEGEIYSTLVGKGKIHLEMMRISHRQFIWQQHRLDWRLIIRYYKIFNSAPINLTSQQSIGLTIDQVFLIGMSFLGNFFDHPFMDRPTKVEIPGLTLEHIEKFLKFTSLNLNELRHGLQAEHALDEGFAYRYSPLREFPLVRFSRVGVDEIACPIPILLAWRITTGLYYALKGERGFAIAFGHAFQAYVGEILSHRITDGAITTLGETEYRVGKRRKDTVDWIVNDGSYARKLVTV
jgi:hypothetical protein